jgi:hypothetical protein
MNILYVGPYRLNNSIGYESLNFLLELIENYKNIISRPLYNQINSIKDDQTSSLLNTIENKSLSKIDIIIQHSDIDSLTYNTKYLRHLFIPITSNRLCKLYQKQKYQFLDQKVSFLYTNDFQEYILSDCSVKNKIRITNFISNKLAVTSAGVFNFGLYNNYKKYYTIVDSSDRTKLEQLIVDFISIHHLEQNCLVLFMTNVTQSILDSYNKFIKKTYSFFDINFSINKIIISPVEINNEIIPAIHNTGSVYIDLNEDIHANYAHKYKKSIIYNSSSLKTQYDPQNLSNTLSLVRSGGFNLGSSNNQNSLHNISLSQVVEKYV